MWNISNVLTDPFTFENGSVNSMFLRYVRLLIREEARVSLFFLYKVLLL